MPPRNLNRQGTHDWRNSQRSLLALGTVIGVSFAQRGPRHSEPPDILHKRVRRLREQGNLEEAESTLKEALACDTCSKFAIYELISLYSHIGQMAKAEAIFDYAHGRDIAGDGIYDAMVSGYCRNRMKDSAMVVFEMAAVRGILTGRACRTMFFLAHDMGDLNMAGKAFSMSASAGHANPVMLSRLVSSIVRERCTDRALRLLRSHGEGLASSRAYHPIAKGLASELRHREAIDLCGEAISRGMADPDMIDSVIRIMDKNGDPCSTWELFWMAERAGIADERLRITIMDMYAKYDKPRRIKIILDSLIKSDSDSREIFKKAIFIFACGHDFGYAGQAINSGCERGKVDADCMLYVFSRLYGEKQFREILALYDKLPPEMRSEPILLLKSADAMRKMGDYAGATERLLELLSQDGLPDIHVRKGYTIMAFCLKDSGRRAEAMELFLAMHRWDVESSCSPRIACGLVFCWQDMGFGSELPPRLQRSLYLQLIGSRTGKGGNLQLDIGKAIEILEARFRAPASGTMEQTGS